MRCFVCNRLTATTGVAYEQSLETLDAHICHFCLSQLLASKESAERCSACSSDAVVGTVVTEQTEEVEGGYESAEGLEKEINRWLLCEDHFQQYVTEGLQTI